MKQVYNYWMPDTDNHFYRMITKRISQGGPAEYQDDVRDAAYKYVKDFDVAIDIGANVGFWARPLTENPSANSGPSLVCPPTRVAPA